MPIGRPASAALIAVLVALVSDVRPAAAASVSAVAVVGGSAIEDQAFVVAVSGDLDPGRSALVAGRLNPSSQPCAAEEAADRDRSVAADSAYAEGHFDESLTYTLDQAGEFRLCLYAGDPLVAEAPVTVRAPVVALALALPSDRFVPGASAPLTLTHSSETRRGLHVALNAAGSACGPSPEANPEVGGVIDYDAGPLVLGQGVTTVVRLTIPEAVGAYHLCGYVVEDRYDAAPDLIVDGAPFTAGTPPPPAAVTPVAVAPVGGVDNPGSCSVRTRSVRRGGRILVRCSGVGGRVTVRLTRLGHTRFRVRARPAQGRVLVSTRRVRAGRYTVTVSTTRGRLARRTVTVRPR